MVKLKIIFSVLLGSDVFCWCDIEWLLFFHLCVLIHYCASVLLSPYMAVSNAGDITDA